nr:MAG TPA: hypothetical protein [Caudoviricetes sp.]
MVINLQFFGGRGGSSGLGKIGGVGLDVTYNGETTRYYFEKHGNQKLFGGDGRNG